MAAGRARFVRKLPSGRWQARYHGADGVDRPAPATFATLTDARVWLSTVEADLVRGEGIDPAGGRVLLRTYADKRWMADRPDLSNRTREKYAGLLKVHILPAFGHREMGSIEPVAVRGWWPSSRRPIRARRPTPTGCSTRSTGPPSPTGR